MSMKRRYIIPFETMRFQLRTVTGGGGKREISCHIIRWRKLESDVFLLFRLYAAIYMNTLQFLDLEKEEASKLVQYLTAPDFSVGFSLLLF